MSLKDWSRATFGSVRKKIRQLEGKIRDIREQELTEDSMRKEKELEHELCELFEREEIMVKQRSRVEWLQEGDRNTSFIHARATARQKTNKIDMLLHADGSKCEARDEINRMVQ